MNALELYEQPMASYPPMPFEFGPMDNLMPYLPIAWYPDMQCTPIERAAMKEYVRRRFARGVKSSDRSEFLGVCTLGEMAEALD
jgi:hypothetical protein